MIRRHPVACFVVVTFAVTWTAWVVLAASGGTVAPGRFSPLYVLGLAGPLVGAVVTTAIVDGRTGLRDLATRMTRVRVGLRWWGVALGIPLAVAALTYVALAAYAVFLFAPVELPSWRALGIAAGFPMTNAIAIGALLVIASGYGQETGWRGFLLPALQRRRSWLTASLIVAAVWAIWYLPAFALTPRAPLAMIPMFVAALVCASVFLGWLYDRGRASIALVAVWHGVFDLATGTVAAGGALAATETAVLMLLALYLVLRKGSARGASSAVGAEIAEPRATVA